MHAIHAIHKITSASKVNLASFSESRPPKTRPLPPAHQALNVLHVRMSCMSWLLAAAQQLAACRHSVSMMSSKASQGKSCKLVPCAGHMSGTRTTTTTQCSCRYLPVPCTLHTTQYCHCPCALFDATHTRVYTRPDVTSSFTLPSCKSRASRLYTYTHDTHRSTFLRLTKLRARSLYLRTQHT